MRRSDPPTRSKSSTPLSSAARTPLPIVGHLEVVERPAAGRPVRPTARADGVFGNHECRLIPVMTDDIVLSPDDYAAWIQGACRAVSSKYGCFAAVRRSSPTIARGTVVFVKRGDGRFVLTAKHVVDGLFARPEKLIIIRAADPSGPSLPIEHAVERGSLVWASDDLDLALLRAPDNLIDARSVGWFDLDEGAHMVTILREWCNRGKELHGAIVFGFPNFTHMAAELIDETMAEILSPTSVPADIADLKPTCDGRSKMVLEITAAGPIPPADKSPLSRAAVDAVRANPPSESRDLGGFSGGPIIVADISGGGTALIGIVSEGTIMNGADFSLKMIRAIPIDEIP